MYTFYNKKPGTLYVKKPGMLMRKYSLQKLVSFFQYSL